MVYLAYQSVDTSPLWLGFTLDSSPEGRRRNAVLNTEDLELNCGLIKDYHSMLTEAGATKTTSLAPVD